MRTLPTREEAVLADVLERRAAAAPDRVFALFDDGRQLTYGELATRTWTVASALRRIGGVRDRETVSAWLPNGEEALLAWFAANASGCMYQPLNTAYKGSLLEHSLNIGMARVLILHADLVDRLAGLDLPYLETLVVVGSGGDGATLGLRRVAWDELLADPVQERPRLQRPVEPWDDITFLMTSGTTGASKAVRRTYVQYTLYTEVNFGGLNATEDDRFYVCAPMFHGGADTPIFSMLQIGASIAVSQGSALRASGSPLASSGAPSHGSTRRCPCFCSSSPRVPMTEITPCGG